MPLKYLSLFSGIGICELAFRKVYPDAVCVGFSEIDPAALAVYKRHFPKHRNYGDIKKIDPKDLPLFDVLVMGSPCTDLSSFQFTKLEWNGTRSILFFDALCIIKHCKPRFFIVENVASMRKERRDDISKALGVEPVMIDSVVFGAAHRRRLYWTNFPVPVPKIDQKLMYTDDILQKDLPMMRPLNLTFKGIPLTNTLPLKAGTPPYNIMHRNHKYYVPRPDNKCNPVLTTQSLLNVVWDGKQLRYMTSIEIERLQTLPDDYTKFGRKEDTGELYEITKTKRHKLVGNAFHLETFVYLLKEMKKYV